MSGIKRVAAPPAKPLLVFDADCGFCRVWIERWRRSTQDCVAYVPLQDESLGQRFPEITQADFARAVHLIEPSGEVYAGAEAVVRALATNPRHRWLRRLHESSPAVARIAEASYQFVARHRTTFSWFTRVGWGHKVARPDYLLVRKLFLAGLGVVYLIAFGSLWSQIHGLVGHDGILPADRFIDGAGKFFNSEGIGADRYRILPTFCWFNASDAALSWQCALGTALSILLIAGIAPAPCLVLLWGIYLSLSTVCREFLSFQWDILLLETGFLAIFLAPLQLWPFGNRTKSPPSRTVLWLLRWLLFQLMFESGVVKLTSGDSTWRNLSALTFHYETQPLPTWIGWYAHQLPLWFQKLSCVVMFGIELGVPLLFFAPRRIRAFAAGATALLQILILLTGNYTFFNWLTLLLCVPLLDDAAIRKWLPRRLRGQPLSVAERCLQSGLRWPRWFIMPFAVCVLCLSGALFLATLGARWAVLSPVLALEQYLAPFRVFNSYGLFRVMTTTRPEIVVQGSRDGTNWLTYEFKWKPGNVKRRPGFVAPHQPRLDWQMWFAALGELRQNPWFGNFAVRLLQGSPAVLDLLETNPFPDKPPRYVRAMLYEYHFTTPTEHRATGQWWRRSELGTYLPPISLTDLGG